MSKLNIYKASAGSGKTFTITKEYIKLLFEDTNNFKQTIAVTFTNKATDEMKSRILKEINNLAKGEKSPYYDELVRLTNNNSQLLKVKAQELLYTILHNYSWFSVTTIDSFFQRIVRAFARETGLQMGFNIELDHDRVLNNVTEKLFSDVDKNKELKRWLISFAEKNIQNGKNWNIKNTIGRLSKEIFKEDYKQFDSILINKLKDKEFLKAYNDTLQSFANKYTSFMEEQGNKALGIITDNKLDINDFPYGKSSFANYFNKIVQARKSKDYQPGKRALDAIDTPDKWITKTTTVTKKASIDAVYSDLNRILKEIIEFYSLNSYLYNSISIILEYIHTLGILTDISKYIREFADEENFFLISDTAHLLNSIIGKNHSPFIYEKVGVKYKHFMIDEFQDTSGMQWANFKPLVENSLSENNYSLIVGDVKQSIYRWRNGDWNLLENKIENDFYKLGTNVQSLNFNWRSKKNVIRFNNSIFHYGVHILQKCYNKEVPNLVEDNLREEMSQIIKAYSTSYQAIPTNSNEGGSVNIEFLEDEKEYAWKEKVLEKLPLKIKYLQDKGYNAGDIAILVRKADEGRKVADCLMEFKSQNKDKSYNFDFISNDSLFLKNSPAIKLIINSIKYLQNPKEKIHKAGILVENNYYFKESSIIEQLFTDVDTIFDKLLPKEFISCFEDLRRMPLYELIEKIIAIFNLNLKKEYFPYLQAFQDMISDYSNQNGSDIKLFMDWWEEQKEKRVISVSENQNAIKILTIHKAKGLEFRAVIIPFCSWELDSQKPQRIIWCKPNEDGINQLNILPVTYTTSLSETIFYKEYFKERLKAYIDNLNLLYVAFTRAEEELIILCPNFKEKQEKILKISDLLHYTISNYKKIEHHDNSLEYINFEKGWNFEKGVYQLGEEISVDNRSKQRDNSLIMRDYISTALDNRLKLKYHNKDYFEFSDNKEIKQFNPVSRGNIMHEILKNIISVKDIKYSVKKLEFEGKISSDQSKSLIVYINNLLFKENINQWFSEEWQVINERDIILKNGKVYRPDRVIIKDNNAVIIDYKTGKEHRKEYHTQVKVYIKALKEIGYYRVEGYLWYLDNNIIEKVL